MNLFGKAWSPFKTFVLVCVLFHLAARVNSMPNNNNEIEENNVADDKDGLIENLQNSDKENQDEKYQNDIRRIESILAPLKRFNEFVANLDDEKEKAKTAHDLSKSDLDIQDLLVKAVKTVSTLQAEIRKKEFEDMLALNYHGTTPGRARWTKGNIQSALFEFNIEDIIAAAEIKKAELVIFKKPDPADFYNPIHLGMEIYYGVDRSYWDGTFFFKLRKGLQRKNLMDLFTAVNPKVMNKKLMIWLRCLSCSHKTFTSVFGHRNEEGPYIEYEIKLSDGQKPKQLNHRKCNPEVECCKRDLELNLREVGMDVQGDHQHIIDYCLGNCDTSLNRQTKNSSDFRYMRMQYVSKDNNVTRRCCVPISYELVTIQLRTSKSDPYRTAKLDGMRVAECGCMW